MKLNSIKYLVMTAVACIPALATQSHAGSFADSFGSNHDYQANGVAGTPWAGMTAGTSTPGTIASWDANVTTPNTLTITNTGGAWADGGDGPFLWSNVKGSGDFTNIVHLSHLDQINYNFAGLLIRNPQSLTNWFYLSVFAEYGVEIDWRDTINGVSAEGTSTGGGYVESSPATWRSWLQITRVGGVISAFVSTDGVSWDLVYQSSRTDLAGDLQVGVFACTFSGNRASAQFQSFSVTGDSVVNNTTPAPATALAVTPQVNSLDISWAASTNGAGSLVLVRRAAPITRQPLDGTNYTGNATFGSGDDLGESNYVAYVGAGTSLTLTNVTPTIPYTVAVYAYSGSGASIVYSLSNTPVATAAPYGVPSGISISFPTNAVAVDDSIQGTVMLNFTGGGSVDVTTSSTFNSSGPALAAVSTSGLVAGLSNGLVTITATNSGFTASSNLTVIKLPVSDDFSSPRNYLTQGVSGTYWSGILLDTNDIDPSLGQVPSGPTATLLANAAISKPHRLTVATHDSGFSPGADSGFFLYRNVSGDFSISIQITRFDSDNGTNAFHMPGLMVRAPFTLAYTESFLQWQAFNEYGIGNFSRRSINGTYAETYFQGSPALPYLKIERVGDTFNFYQKAHGLDAWTLVGSENRPEYTGVAMQVGLMDQTFTANTASTEFANLLLTVPGGLTNNMNAPSAPTGLSLSNNATGHVLASWTPGTGSSGSIVIAHVLSGTTRQPTDGDDYSATANADFSLGQNLGASNIVVFAGAGTSVDVSNLPGVTRYFSVYSYATVSGTNYYNISNPASSSIAPTPPSVSAGISSLGGGVYQVSWPQGTLLEATNLGGPWTTNLATSPYMITNPVGNRFFRIQVQ